ncbi:MAG: NTP/NDP exchange transporter [Chlamydiia bacterium]|nr:NTP/NDP exchange transporter [Chlamydiia bacterium]
MSFLKKALLWVKNELFPIHRHELKKFLPMAFMMFFILFNYTVVRNLKDTLVVNGQNSGAGILSFLKLWGTMPSAVLFFVIYSKMMNVFSKEKVFYICVATFVAFFGIYTYVIYPNMQAVHPDPQTIATLQEQYPYIKWFISMWANWASCLFYICAELWGSVMVSLLFWQFANQITPTSQAKRFYPLFGFIAALSLILTGPILRSLDYIGRNMSGADAVFTFKLNAITAMFIFSAAMIAALYTFVNKAVVPGLEAANTENKPKKKKPKLSMGESLKTLVSSKHLLSIAVLVLAYGVTINYIDVLWKDQVKLMTLGDKNSYFNFMNKFTVVTGYIQLGLMLVGGMILRRFSWRTAASIVPTILVALYVGFFSLVYYGTNNPDINHTLFPVLGLTANAIVHIGLWGGALAKSSKYSLFDSTKEMAYIPLDDELKTKGKAAVDVIGGRLGKSGGALTFNVLQTVMPSASLASLTPYLASIAGVIFVCWYMAVGRLSKSLKVMNAEQDEAGEAKAEPLAAAAK